MLVFPNAKINLGLDIVAKRSDGFHDIETVFYPIPICDVLEIVESKNNKTTFHNSGIAIDGDVEKNLCVRAFRLLQQKFQIPDVDIFLHKKIPFGAGLGGGSSDAAYTLTILNKMFSLNLNDDTLIDFASRLGSDCAFFIKNKAMSASGRGEILQDVNINLRGYYFVLVKPNIGVNTAQAYSNIKPQNPQKHIVDIVAQPIETWRDELKNDFEKTIFEQYPEIKTIKETLYDSGAVYASMSGSGSSVFGLFKEKTAVDFADNGYFVFESLL